MHTDLHIHQNAGQFGIHMYVYDHRKEQNKILLGNSTHQWKFVWIIYSSVLYVVVAYKFELGDDLMR